MPVELNRMLTLVVEKRATELRLTVDAPPRVKIKGRERPLNLSPLTTEDTLRYLKEVAPESRLKEFQEQGSCEFGMPFQEQAHFLVTAQRQDGRCLLRFQLVPRRTTAEG